MESTRQTSPSAHIVGTSLSELVAIMVAYRRLLVVWAVPPFLMVILPIMFTISLSLLNKIAAGYGTLSAFLAIILTVLGRHTIHQYAPSPKQRDEALSQSTIPLPVLSFVLARTLSIKLLSPIGWRLGLDRLLAFTPAIDFATTVRVAASMALLSSALIFRYVGRGSVVRCSSTPLPPNPSSASLRSSWNRWFSVDSWLEMIARPSDSHEVLVEASCPLHASRRRYQYPSLAAWMSQILVSILIGTLVTIVAPVWNVHNENYVMFHMFRFAACILTIMAHLVGTLMLFGSHELDPNRYMHMPSQQFLSFLPLPLIKHTGFISSIILVPLLAAAGAYLSDKEIVTAFTTTLEFIRLGIFGIILTGLLTMYLILVDEMIRRALCVPGVNLSRVLRDLSEEATLDAQLEVFLQSILYGDETLVRAVARPTQRPGLVYVEVEEMRKNEENRQHMQHVLLGADRHANIQRAHLEQDVLRVALLESIGGRGKAGDLGKATPRHVDAVQRWVKPHSAVWIDESSAQEPVAVPLVRGLCTYIAGLGDALFLCSLPPNDPRRLAVEDHRSAPFSWSLPPAARACAEWAVMGASRCLVYSFASSQPAATPDWRSSALAVLLPMVLQSYFCLRCGVQSFAETGQTELRLSRFDSLSIDNRSLQTLVATIDEAALLILGTIQSLDGPRKLDLPVSSDCNFWLHDLAQAL